MGTNTFAVWERWREGMWEYQTLVLYSGQQLKDSG